MHNLPANTKDCLQREREREKNGEKNDKKAKLKQADE